MKALLGIIFFAALFSAVAFLLQRPETHPAYRNLCRLVSQAYYNQDNNLEKWTQSCLRRAESYRYSNLPHLVARLRAELSLLGGSHLELYAPVEHHRVWSGRSNGDTGLRSRFVEGELVVYEVLPGSPAMSSGIEPGDIIKSINGDHPHSIGAQNEEGLFEIQNAKGVTKIHQLTLGSLTIDESPRAMSLGDGSGYLKVPSFRGELFSEESLAELSAELARYPKGVVLDLRNNLGGNLIAGMRLLGSLLCAKKEVGLLLKSTEQTPSEQALLLNDLSDEAQLQQISEVSKVSLQSYPPQNCKVVPIVVLIDHSSSSTSEIVAWALRYHRKARLLGTPTAGQVLIAVWYDFSELGAGYSLSIPERRYVSSSGEELEGVGVYPDQTLYYKLPEARAGKDSWLLRAADLLDQEQ